MSGEDRLVDGVRGLVGQGDAERLLDLHEQLDQIEAVAPQVFDDPVAGRDPVPADAQLLGGDVADPPLDLVEPQPCVPGHVPASSFSAGENPHLRRRAERLVFRPDRQEPDRIAEPPGDALGPVLELLPGPLEAVVGMAELARPRRSPTSRCTPGSASSARPSAAGRTRTAPARRPTAGAGRGARRPRRRRRRRSPPAACPGTSATRGSA